MTSSSGSRPSVIFLSTPSVRRATIRADRRGHSVNLFLSTPSVRRATHPCYWAGNSSLISIHALREEGDVVSMLNERLDSIISIHALREEGDDQIQERETDRVYFYPRPP